MWLIPLPGVRALRRVRDSGSPPPLHPLAALLVDRDLLDEARARKLEAAAAHAGEPLPRRLVAEGVIGAEELAGLVAERYGLPRVGEGDLPDAPPEVRPLSVPFLRRRGLLPLAVREGRLRLAMVDPLDLEALRALEVACGLPAEPCVVDVVTFERGFARLFEAGAEALDRLVAEAGAELAEETDGGEGPGADAAPVVRLVHRMLAEAVEAGASDLHVEPDGERLRIRRRVHGRLQEVAAPSARLAPAVIARLKILAGLDVAERRLPQDGRARLELLGREVDLRVATMPTVHGESAVVRILDHARRRLPLSELGLPPAQEARLRRHIHAPYGMVLVTGPTGSGKTTTLHAALAELDANRHKIVSVEDPVEYRLPGITQVQVRPEVGLDFARVLRSVLRHDPDVIMVGETRDPETAHIAVHAALTGHLVFTTLHTDTACGSVGRLLDMGIEPYLLASVLRAALGQRLVGRLCPDCRRPRPPDPLEQTLFADHGLEPPGAVFEAEGCTRCSGIGYVGRVGLFELVEFDDGLREAVRARTPTRELERLARARGFGSMRRDGLVKAREGIVALADVLRTTEG